MRHHGLIIKLQLLKTIFGNPDSEPTFRNIIDDTIDCDPNTRKIQEHLVRTSLSSRVFPNLKELRPLNLGRKVIETIKGR